MSHIHTKPNQHDLTVSAYIFRLDGSVPKLLVHMHRKYDKLMQIGGHIELDETPWQAIAHELAEESGYRLDELQVLQPRAVVIDVDAAIVHPVPVVMNTHKASDKHYHSELCFAFVADKEPLQKPADGESTDLRWLTRTELRLKSEQGIAAANVGKFYETILDQFLDRYDRIPAQTFSLEEPKDMSL